MVKEIGQNNKYTLSSTDKDNAKKMAQILENSGFITEATKWVKENL